MCLVGVASRPEEQERNGNSKTADTEERECVCVWWLLFSEVGKGNRSRGNRGEWEADKEGNT